MAEKVTEMTPAEVSSQSLMSSYHSPYWQYWPWWRGRPTWGWDMPQSQHSQVSCISFCTIDFLTMSQTISSTRWLHSWGHHWHWFLWLYHERSGGALEYQSTQASRSPWYVSSTLSLLILDWQPLDVAMWVSRFSRPHINITVDKVININTKVSRVSLGCPLPQYNLPSPLK